MKKAVVEKQGCTHVTEEMKRKEAAKIVFIGMNPIGVKLA